MPTTHDWRPGHMQELDAAECWELVGGRTVGRVGFSTGDGPLVLPVNFVVHEGDVLFRTSPHNVIAAHLDGQQAAFEVDDIDDFTQSGWSVLIQGRADFLESVAELAPDAKPLPWPEGVRSLFVRITTRSVTGRRLFPT
jgi:nitroimidazol reductase NimA-like FMN-containing flavoprotein (pyridoxamine 5'-phosphate oxidase superfamily)